ncbi:MAG: smc [Acidimicrobiales bacterium]|nr:smc [Acidimicrobiales bacterium]
MFLKTLTIKGFKSFADATALTMEPGVTVVVGPNGSGKSNVVDAIGWVLGAQAPSAVRSQKMDDVIFAGSQRRAALGRAEVSLTIDNSAGLLPIEFTEVTITRTLFRSGDSEYAINGVPCRLLDIQELLSDTGVGRQQHVIISQGQIDAVLNARPEDRRLIIEEAAGVLKFRRRKEKAERRIGATEGNLTRLQDLLREVRRQLRPLERQADAARRHGAVAAELSAVRTFVAGQELLRLRARLEAAERGKREQTDAERELRFALRRLDADVLAAEARLGAMGGDDLGDALVRFESLREKARGLAAVLTERRRGIERDRGASVDRAVIATLEAEAARLRRELDEVEAQGAALLPDADRLSEAEATLESERAAFDADWSGGVPAPTGAAAEVRGELAAMRASAERSEGEAARVHARLGALDEKAVRLAAEAERLRADLTEADAAERPLVTQLEQAEAHRAAAEAALIEAEDAQRATDADRNAWTARAEALAVALDEARARAGAERLASIDGVIGTLLDVIDVDPGWEAAVEAAAGEAIAAVVVDSVDAGRRALDELRRGDVAGAVLALGAGRVDLAPPVGGEPVRAHVRSTRDGVDPLLDVLFGSAVSVERWEAAVDLVLAHPEVVVVTTAGDRFGPTGWRIGVAAAGATGAALDEARQRSDAAAVVADQARATASERRAALDVARRAEADLTKALDQNDGRMRAAGDALQRVENDRRDTATEAESIREHIAELGERVARDQARVDELEVRLPRLEAEEASAAERGRAMAEARRRLDERAGAVASLRSDLEVRAAGLEDRRQFLRRRLAEVDERLSRDVAEREAAASRRVDLDRRALATERLANLVADRLTVVESELAGLRERRRRQSEATREVSALLDASRKERADTERRLTEVRERVQRSELEQAETKVRLEAAVESVRRDLDCEPEQAMAAPDPELAEGVTPVGRVRELERELRIMGPINPLALEEYDALLERHGFLEAQLEDVKATRRDLAKVIRAIDAEIVNVFAAAYADVAQNFADLFETLFPGGKGRLKLTEPENMLDTGIEVEARPSGKNVRKLSLLSGGERSLTALAYLFAVFRARPSPFYVMDEVEAALDDVNLHRFLDLVHEFRADAQLIIVSHQKRTMEAADCLYGVTMEPGGSSRVLSERVQA